MVIKKGHDPALVQEVISHFFGVGTSEVEPATKSEQETFLDLLENPAGELMALDYLNCWLISRNLPGIPDEMLKNLHNSAIIKSKGASPRKKTKNIRT